MKAILVGKDKKLTWDNVPDPVIKSEEVLVEIYFAAYISLFLRNNMAQYFVLY
mgnify:CR=1 FL=1